MVRYGQKNPTLSGLGKNLRRDGIDMVLRRNEQGTIYGITFIHHRSKAVFKGSALGKEFSAKGITEWCRDTDSSLHQQQSQMIGKSAGHSESVQHVHQMGLNDQFENGKTAADALFSPVQDNGYPPQELRKAKKKKQKGFSMGF